MKRTLAIGVIGLIVVAALVSGYWLINPGVASKLLATTDAGERTVLAQSLVESESPTAVAKVLTSGNADVQRDVIQAISQLPDGDPRFAGMAETVLLSLDGIATASLDLACSLAIRLASIDPVLTKTVLTKVLTYRPDCQEAVCAIAAKPEFELTSEIAVLLKSESPAVRKAAVLAIGPNRNGVNEEDLFRLMSDAESDVRLATSVALSARGLSDRQIDMGRKLVHAESRERLSLLIDLKFHSEDVRDPGPWLMRLSQDSDPAVRAGAARLAYECRVSHCAWLDDLADRDPDGLVRSVAGHYRQRSQELRAAGGWTP
jgi:hypothetical protein